jgi:hypothetical protein
MRFVRFIVTACFLSGLVLAGPTLLCGCGSSYKEGTMVERTPEQQAGEKASIKGMMEVMKGKAKTKKR